MIGQYIRNYKITAHLGEGGMGTVYSATDDVLGRNVALKMLHSSLTKQHQFLDRFKKEARVLAQLLHPNIAVIYNFIEQDDNHYMVMEFVEGRNLEWIQKTYRNLPVNVIVAIFLQALEGLRHAHKKGILHRDIKPANLNLTPDGTVKLMDFGIALMAGEQRLTQVNRIVGTVEFMAPELIQGKEPSPASDLYAVGVTMYELLTGRLPFESNTDYNLMQEILKKKPLPVDKVNPSIGKNLSAIIMKSLEKNPDNRYADAKMFQQALLAAYPETKDVDLSLVYSSPSIAPTQVVQLSSINNSATRTDNPTVTFATITAGISSRIAAMKFNQMVVVVGAVVLIVSIILIASGGSSTPTILASTEISNSKDSQAVSNGESGGGVLTLPVNPVPLIIPEERPDERKSEVQEEEQPKAKEKPPETKQEKPPAQADRKAVIEKEKDSVSKTEPVPAPAPIKEDPVMERKPSAKSIHIDSRLEVNLYLLNPIDASTATVGQQLQFSVTSPVRYAGEVIIENGATATGQIKSVNNKKISILIVNVIARNGQKLPFVATEFSGRTAHMLSSRNYSASLKKGTTINL